MSTQEGGPASAAPPPREVIDTTQDGCAGPAAAGMDGSSSSAGSSRGSGSSGTSGGSGSSHGLTPASASPSAPPAASLAVRRGTLRSWAVGKGSPQALDVFCQVNLPKSRQQARSRVGTSSSPNPPESQVGGTTSARGELAATTTPKPFSFRVRGSWSPMARSFASLARRS